MRVVLSVLVGCTALVAEGDPAGADSTGAGSGGGAVSVGAGSGVGLPGSGGSTSGGAQGGGSSGTSPWICTYTYLTINNEGGFPDGGPQPGAWYSVTCDDASSGAQVTQTVWITGSQPVTAPTVDPRALALEAENSMELPRPALRTDPPGTSVVGLATWFWIDPTLWHSVSVTATAGSVSATAVATPVDIRWATGDGATLVCSGPGVPYAPWIPAAVQASTCAYTYRRTSIGQPSPDGDADHAAFVVTASVDWVVSWNSTGVAGGGPLPSLVTSDSSPLRVAQIESVNAVPGGWTAPLASTIGGFP
jgi:hypothetical protein